jgi:opacity protein-like surface antigen
MKGLLGNRQKEKTMTMKTLITAVAVTAALATPSFAQARTQHKPDLSGYGSYGTYGPQTMHRSRGVHNERGNYVGRDPDPTVRNQLRHDPTQGD